MQVRIEKIDERTLKVYGEEPATVTLLQLHVAKVFQVKLDIDVMNMKPGQSVTIEV